MSIIGFLQSLLFAKRGKLPSPLHDEQPRHVVIRAKFRLELHFAVDLETDSDTLFFASFSVVEYPAEMALGLQH